jgi:hypothetical protein
LLVPTCHVTPHHIANRPCPVSQVQCTSKCPSIE